MLSIRSLISTLRRTNPEHGPDPDRGKHKIMGFTLMHLQGRIHLPIRAASGGSSAVRLSSIAVDAMQRHLLCLTQHGQTTERNQKQRVLQLRKLTAAAAGDQQGVKRRFMSKLMGANQSTEYKQSLSSFIV